MQHVGLGVYHSRTVCTHVQRRGACPSLPHTLSACRDTQSGLGCLLTVHSALWCEEEGREGGREKKERIRREEEKKRTKKRDRSED